MTARAKSHQHPAFRRVRAIRGRGFEPKGPPKPRPFSTSNPRDVRRSLGWPSGRQWTKMRKADAREERANARSA